MRYLINGPRIMLILYLVTISVSAYAHSNSWKFKENNNNVIRLQTQGVDPAKAGDVKIEFYRHMAFKITSPDGICIMIAPWRTEP